jgi:hypothetical protein
MINFFFYKFIPKIKQNFTNNKGMKTEHRQQKQEETWQQNHKRS